MSTVDIELRRRRERYEVHAWTDAGLLWMNDNVECHVPGLAFINHDSAEDFAVEVKKAGLIVEIK